jgi:siroheme synthase
MATDQESGRCYLVGAGPGDLGLVTLRAKQLIERAELIVYDYLCNPEVLQWAPETAEIVYAGKKAGAHTLEQDEINALLVEGARAGKQVVRLKGGDPFLFGPGSGGNAFRSGARRHFGDRRTSLRGHSRDPSRNHFACDLLHWS